MSNTIGLYCKAYYLKQLRAFPGWSESSEAAPREGEAGRLGDESIVYLHDDLTVTDGVFKDEFVLFKDVNETWTAFCRETLAFEVPPDVIEAQRLVEQDLAEEAAS